MNNNNINYHVERTREANICELVSAILAAIALVLSIVGMTRDVKDGTAMLLLSVCFGGVSALMLYLAYHPTLYNIPDDSPASLYAATARFVRIAAVGLALLAVAANASDLLGLGVSYVLITMGVLFMPLLYWYVVQYLRASVKPKND